MTSGNGNGGPTPEEIDRIKQRIKEQLDKEAAEKKAAEQKKEEDK